MTTNFILGSATALLLTGAASADFLGFNGTLSTNSQGNNVAQVFAVFDNSDAVVLNVFNADISTETSTSSAFIHSDVQVNAGGTWNPTASLDIPGFSDSSNDSYVTIGYGVGTAAATNGTALDPGFGSGLGGTIPVGAGWYNGNPNDPQSVFGGFSGICPLTNGFAVMLGQFVWSGQNIFEFNAEIGFNSGPGTQVEFGEGGFSTLCPAPGALALLGLGGFATRPRRE